MGTGGSGEQALSFLPPLHFKQRSPVSLGWFYSRHNLSLGLALARSGWSLSIPLFHTQKSNNGEPKPSFGRDARSQGSSAICMLFMFTFYR